MQCTVENKSLFYIPRREYIFNGTIQRAALTFNGVVRNVDFCTHCAILILHRSAQVAPSITATRLVLFELDIETEMEKFFDCKTNLSSGGGPVAPPMCMVNNTAA
jgi:hypothetical protein